MENPARTQQFLAILQQRKVALRETLARIFPQPTSFVGEFGSGHGHFLVAYAQAHPDSVCVGVDLERDRVERATRKQVRAKLPRLHFLQADARLFLESLPPETVFSRLFILFPDPWPKKRHHKNRLIQSSFLDEIRRRSSETTRIFFRTDHEPYFEAARVTFARHAAWEIADEPWAFEHETVFQSRAASFRSFVARPRSIVTS